MSYFFMSYSWFPPNLPSFPLVGIGKFSGRFYLWEFIHQWKALEFPDYHYLYAVHTTGIHTIFALAQDPCIQWKSESEFLRPESHVAQTVFFLLRVNNGKSAAGGVESTFGSDTNTIPSCEFNWVYRGSALSIAITFDNIVGSFKFFACRAYIMFYLHIKFYEWK